MEFQLILSLFLLQKVLKKFLLFLV